MGKRKRYNLEYSVPDGARSHSTRLSVTIRRKKKKHVDIFDVASAQRRQRFAADAAKAVGCSVEEVVLALTELADRRLNTAIDCGTETKGPTDPLRLSDGFLGERYIRDSCLLLRYWNEDFYQFDQASWMCLPNDRVIAQVTEYLEKEFDALAAKQILTKGYRYSVTRPLINDVLLGLKSRTIANVTVDPPMWVDADAKVLPDPNLLLACPNGILDLSRECPRLLENDPRLFNLNATTFPYQEGADCPRWRELLVELWDNDHQSEQLLQEFFGLCMTSDTRFQKILLMIGPPRSGRGTIMRVLTALLGPRNVCGPTIGGIGGEFGLQPFLGKTVAIFNDARVPSGSQSRAIERLLSISGEDLVTVNRKNQTQVEAKLRTRLIIVSNELPELRDASRALARRFLILRFRNSWLENEDPNLTETLLLELPGILNWALEGLSRLRQRRKFQQPAASLGLVRDIERLSSPFHAFLEDRCQVGPDRSVVVQELFDSYRRWCGEHNVHALHQEAFGKGIRSALPALSIRQRRVAGAGRVREYVGVGLRRPRQRNSRRPEPPSVDR